MGHTAKFLNPGEEVALDVRPHWKYLAGPVFAVAVVLAGAGYALAANFPRWAELVLAAVLVVCLVWLVARYTRWTTTHFMVTNQRLVLRKGIFGRSGREIFLDRLTDISYHQSLVDRLVGAGDILLESPGRDSQEVFEDLPHPVLIQNEINRLVSFHHSQYGPVGGGVAGAPVGAAYAGGTAGGGATSGPGDAGDGGTGPGAGLAEQLDQLDQLRKRGVISRREFAAKKAELLSRM
jgi:membrane protein YdbS with pleckstrin-like domain